MADVYVVTAPDKSVYSLSEQDDAVVPNGYQKSKIVNKQIKDLTVTSGEEKMYDFSGNKFTLNAKKVQDKNKAEQDLLIAVQAKQTNRISAIGKLKALGLTDAELEAIIKQGE